MENKEWLGLPINERLTEEEKEKLKVLCFSISREYLQRGTHAFMTIEILRDFINDFFGPGYWPKIEKVKENE